MKTNTNMNINMNINIISGKNINKYIYEKRVKKLN